MFFLLICESGASLECLYHQLYIAFYSGPRENWSIHVNSTTVNIIAAFFPRLCAVFFTTVWNNLARYFAGLCGVQNDEINAPWNLSGEHFDGIEISNAGLGKVNLNIDVRRTRANTTEILIKQWKFGQEVGWQTTCVIARVHALVMECIWKAAR